MKVNVNVKSFILLNDALKRKNEIQVDLSGSTLGDLIQILTQRYGQVFKETLLDEAGEIPYDVRIVKNMKDFLVEDRMNATLQEGDTLYFMVSG